MNVVRLNINNKTLSIPDTYFIRGAYLVEPPLYQQYFETPVNIFIAMVIFFLKLD